MLFGLPPIVRVIDFEATGLGAGERVVEVGWADLDPISAQVIGWGSYLCRVPSMPPEVRAVHHIRAEHTADFPPYDRRILFEEAARAGVVAFAAHTADFEAQHLCGSIPLVCTYKAALRQWPDAPGHSVFALLYWLEDQGLIEYDQAVAHPPHRALPDAYATAIILGRLYAEGVRGKDLIAWTEQPRLLPKCPIGTWRGHKWEDVDWGFLDWILSKYDMDPDIRWNAQREKDRRMEESRG